MADSLSEPIAWIDRLFQEAYSDKSPGPLEERAAAIEDRVNPAS